MEPACCSSPPPTPAHSSSVLAPVPPLASVCERQVRECDVHVLGALEISSILCKVSTSVMFLMPVMNTYESSETYLCIVLVVVSYVGVAEGVARRRCRKFLPLYTTLEDWLSQRIRSDRDVAPSHVYVSQFGGGRLYYCQGLPFLGFYTHFLTVS